MIEILLAGFIWFFAPIPWIVVAVHVLVKNEKWKQYGVKMAFLGIMLSVYIILLLLMVNFYESLFFGKFEHLGAQVIGTVILICAAVIEVMTQKTLGVKRVFGSSEMNQTDEGLITTGIYKLARHPRYAEHPMWALGLGLAFGYPFLLFFFLYLLLGFNLVARFEEKELLIRYGKEYLEYKKKTPAYFI